jgi:micrococcal nuclease
MYEYRAKLIRVVDADTFDVDLDLGFNVHTHARLRLSGVDAPEVGTDEGARATQIVTDWLVTGTEMVVRTRKTRKGTDGKDLYGRYVATVTVNGVSVNQFLLDNGLAQPYK